VASWGDDNFSISFSANAAAGAADNPGPQGAYCRWIGFNRVRRYSAMVAASP